MASLVFNKMREQMFLGLDMENDDIYAALAKSGWTPNEDTDEFIDDMTNEHPDSGQYVSGGKQITNVAVTKDDVNDRSLVDGDDIVWINSLITDARYLTIYKNTGTPSTSPLLLVFDFGSDQSNGTGDNFTIIFDSLGFVKLTKV